MVSEPTDFGTHTFQGKHSGEKIQFYFRQHWIRLVWPFVKVNFISLLLLVIGTFFLTDVSDDDLLMRRFVIILLLSLFLIAQFEFLLKLYRYFLYVIVVTDKKVHRIKKTLFVFDDHQSVDLWMVQDIYRKQHGIVQNIFRFGTLVLEVQDTELRMHFVPRIEAKYEKLMHLREQARTQMSYGPGSRPN